MTIDFDKYHTALENADVLEHAGRVTKIVGLAVEATGPSSKIGDICELFTLDGERACGRKS